DPYEAVLELPVAVPPSLRSAQDLVLSADGIERDGGRRDRVRSRASRINNVREEVDQLGGLGVLDQRGTPSNDGVLESRRALPHLLGKRIPARRVGSQPVRELVQTTGSELLVALNDPGRVLRASGECAYSK